MSEDPVSDPQLRLTGRQRREREFYEEYSRTVALQDVDFAPVLGCERRPWNSYWYAYELAAKLADRPERRILDFGCGRGVTAIRLASLGYEAFGFDIAPANVTIARTLARRCGLDNRTHFSVQAAESLGYRNDFFDAVVGLDILHHVEIGPALSECLRVMKAGATAIFREHIEVPILDGIRETRLLRWLVPKGKSLSKDRHITEDERKLNAEDMRLIRSLCPDLSTRRFTFLSRLDLFFRRPDNPRPSLLERIDRCLFGLVPFSSRFGAGVVIVFRKPSG